MAIQELLKKASEKDIFSDIPENEQSEVKLKGKIAVAIINKRYELNMNQEAFAEMMGVSQAMVSKWESGDYNFTCDTLEQIIDKIGLSLILEDKSPNAPQSVQHNPAEDNYTATGYGKFNSDTFSLVKLDYKQNNYFKDYCYV